MLRGTKLFFEARDHFKKHGVYTKALEGTYAFNEFWDEETRRCREGYSNGDFNITGNFYFYLNYNQIQMKDPRTGRKTRDFPLFTDVDYEFFNLLKKAELTKKGLILLKPRRTGFSWKLSSIAAHEFNFYKDSFTVISAFEDKYSSNTFNMAKEHLNFLFNTPWYKPRTPDTSEFVQAKHLKKIDGKEVWVGYMSAIRKLTFKDNPFASAGASVSKFIFDEGGIFPNIKESYNISEPTWRDGQDVTGTPIILGTGGDMGKGTHAFSEMFYNPETYNLLALDNIWDANMSGRKCGWFFPASRQRFGIYVDPETKVKTDLIDEDGNSNQVLGEKAVLEERHKKANDPIAFRDSTTQYPLNTSEGFLISTGNIFPTIALKEQKAKIEGDPNKYLDSNIVCDIYINDTAALELKVHDVKRPIRKYPIRREERFGAVELYELPQKNSDEEIYTNRYIGGIDPYDSDEAPTSVSLGSILIFDRITEKIVAEYTERPEKASEFYENCRRLLMFYKARGLTENNKLGIVTYFEQMKSSYLLAETPVQLRNKLEWKANLNTSYGYNTTQQTNRYGDSLIVQWLKTNASFAQSSEVKNSHQIYSLALLDELIQFNPDPKLNFDRISALRAVLIYHDTLYKSTLNSTSEAEEDNVNQWSNYFSKVNTLNNSNIMYSQDTNSEVKARDYSNSWIGMFEK